MNILEVMNTIRDECPKILEELRKSQSFKECIKNKLSCCGTQVAELRVVDECHNRYRVSVFKIENQQNCTTDFFFMVEINDKVQEVMQL